MNLHEDHRNPEIDAGLHGLSDRLDELGAFEGRAADAGLEERLTRAVGGVFAPEPIVFRREGGVWWRSGALRVAAGVGLACGLGLVVFSQTRPGAPAGSATVSVASVEQRIDGLLALAEGSDGFGDEVASIELWAEALGSDLGGWDDFDLLDGGLWEGAL